MYKKDKSVKLSLRHLNDCFYVFKEISKQQNITEENESQYINVLLKSYLTSDNIIDQEKILKYSETENKIILSYEDLENLQNIKNIRLETIENKNIQKTK